MATLYLGVFLSTDPTPTWSRANVGTNNGWSGSPVYTDADTSPSAPATYEFNPDVSGLAASTSYAVYVVWDDGSTTVGPVTATQTTASAVVSGSLSVSETGNDTLSAAGQILVSGSLTASESGSDTLSITGSVYFPGVSGNLNVSESGSDTFSAAGGITVTGSLTVSESGQDNFSAAGVVTVSGTLSAQESGADTFVSSGAILVSGTLTAQESGSDTALIVGGNFITGTLSVQESGSDSASLSGAVFVSGNLTVSESGSDSAGFSGGVTVSGALAVSESGSDTAYIPGSSLGSSVTITAAQAKLLFQVYLLHGLHSDNLQVSATSRSAGGVQQTVSSLGGATTIETIAAPSTLPVEAGLMIEELAALHGLTAPLTVTASSRSAGSISQSFSTVSGVTTVARV